MKNNKKPDKGLSEKIKITSINIPSTEKSKDILIKLGNYLSENWKEKNR